MAFKNDFQHFNSLSPKAKSLLFSTSLFQLGIPITTIFLNVYLWRESSSVVVLALYNVATFITLPVGFALVSLLIRRWSIGQLFFISNLMHGLVLLPLMFLPSVPLEVLILFGSLYGISHGLHWGIRNLLRMVVTNDEDRTYYFSLDMSLTTLLSVIVPPIIGLLIAWGINYLYLPVSFLYQVTLLVGTGIFALSGWLMLINSYQTPPLSSHSLKVVSPSWWKIRGVALTIGLADGFWYYLPTILVLLLVGKEGALGLAEGFSALISSLLLYDLGKRLKAHLRLKALLWGYAFYILGSVLLVIHFSYISALSYLFLINFAGSFIWANYLPMFYKLIEKETKTGPNPAYGYIFDHEVFLNIGRISSAFLLCFLIFYSSEEAALRLAPLIAALAQASGYLLVKRVGSSLVKRVKPAPKR